MRADLFSTRGAAKLLSQSLEFDFLSYFKQLQIMQASLFEREGGSVARFTFPNPKKKQKANISRFLTFVFLMKKAVSEEENNERKIAV